MLRLVVSVISGAIWVNSSQFLSECRFLIRRWLFNRGFNGHSGLWLVTNKTFSGCPLRFLGIVVVNYANEATKSAPTRPLLGFSMVQSHMSHPVLTTHGWMVIRIGLVWPLAGLSTAGILGLVSLICQVKIKFGNLSISYFRISWLGLFILLRYLNLDLFHVHIGIFLLGWHFLALLIVMTVHRCHSPRCANIFITCWRSDCIFDRIVNGVIDSWLFV